MSLGFALLLLGLIVIISFVLHWEDRRDWQERQYRAAQQQRMREEADAILKDETYHRVMRHHIGDLPP